MDELERFKTEINLTEFAASLGYQLDRRKSSRSSIVMRNAEGDKVIITRKEGGHWTYFSVRESLDHGSIIDFLQFREGINLGGVRNRLRPWISGMAVPGFKGMVIVMPERVPVFKNQLSFGGCSYLVCRWQHGVGKDVFAGPGVGIAARTVTSYGVQKKEPIGGKVLPDNLKVFPVILESDMLKHANAGDSIKWTDHVAVILQADLNQMTQTRFGDLFFRVLYLVF